MDERERQFRAVVAYAQDDPDVVGLYVFGSRARDDGLRDEYSDYDVAVVLNDRDGVLEAFDARWPYVHGASVEVARSTVGELRRLAEYGGPDEWSRYLYTRVDVILDKTGEIAAILREKVSVPDDVRDEIVRDALNGYINSTFRSLRYRKGGAIEGARLDAAESLPFVLGAIFAMDGRVCPFNMYLATELRERPLSDPAWEAEHFLPRLTAILEGDIEAQRSLFRDVDRVARVRGFAGRPSSGPSE